MLDRWSAPSSHQVAIVYRDRVYTKRYRSYRLDCACGWRSPEIAAIPVIEPCPVGLALAVREKHLKQKNERVEWRRY